MAEYGVGAGGDFKTLREAANAAKPGDVMTILPGTYREAPSFNVRGVEWRAAEPGTAIIDGGWNGKTTIDGHPSQIGVGGDGTILRGLTIRNCQGRAIGVTVSNVKILNCTIERTYHGAILLKGGNTPKTALQNILVEGCDISETSLSWVTETRPKNVNGCFNIHNVIDSIIRNNVIRRGYGEGVNVGRGSMRVLVVGNVVYSMNHVLVYFNRCIDCEARGNLLFHVYDPAFGGKTGTSYSAAFVFGDERGRILDVFPNQARNRVINNLVINPGKWLQIRNNTGNYDTVFEGCVIEGNTFVAGPQTEQGIAILSNRHGRVHADSVIRNNVFHYTHARKGAIGAHAQGSGVLFEANAWSERPTKAMQSDSDVYGELRLANADAVIDPEVGLVPDNYRPVAGSPLVMSGGWIGALGPIGSEPEEPPVDPPEEPPVDPPEEPGLDAQVLEGLRVMREKMTAALEAGEEMLGSVSELIALLDDE